jgi:Uma2 family endonuclease
MATQPEARLTAEEYARLPEILGWRDELIEGERVLSPMPKKAHALVLDTLQKIIEAQFPDKRVAREFGWYFQSAGLESVPGPDLMLVSVEDYESSTPSGWFEGKPLFVVEVISPSERKSRRLQKVGLYLEGGAGAVVEVDMSRRIVLVHRPEEEVPVVLTDRIESPFLANLDEIFARVPKVSSH